MTNSYLAGDFTLKPSANIPTNLESQFELDELFFSTTDDKGLIKSGNDIFARVSKYPVDEIIGKPHSLVRHPDMPRCVFKLLWEKLHAGRPIAAYVKNLASDGSYYWVVALATPIPGGYLSVRLKPSSAYFQVVQAIYPELRALEKETGDRGEARREGMLLSEQRLNQVLQEEGFSDYDAFMRTFLREELKSRDALLSRSATQKIGVSRTAGPAVPCTDRAKSVDTLRNANLIQNH